MKQKERSKFLIIVGIILITFVGGYYLYKYISYKEEVNYEINLINDYIENTDTKEEIIPEEIVEVKEEKKEDNKNYFMVIEIPKISLKKGLCKIGESCNKVSKNIEILKESDMPDIDRGNLILASHNGNSNVSFFDKLNRLKVNDTIYIFYKNIKYEYKLNNQYEIDKVGTAVIHRDGDKNTLILITCKKHSRTKQIVYVAYLVRSEKY